MYKNRKKKEASIQANLKKVREQAEIARQEADRIRQEQFEQERKKCETEDQAEQERLTRLMQIKNLFPRLQCSDGNESFT